MMWNLINTIEMSATIELLTISEVAELMKLSESYIYKRVRARELPHLKIGNLLRFKAEEVLGWLEGKRVATKQDVKDAALTYVRSNPLYMNLPRGGRKREKKS